MAGSKACAPRCAPSARRHVGAPAPGRYPRTDCAIRIADGRTADASVSPCDCGQQQEVARAAEKRDGGGAREENDRVQSVTLHAESQRVVAVLHGRGDERQDRNEIEVLLNSVRATGMGLSAGAVRWAARASVLLASAPRLAPARPAAGARPARTARTRARDDADDAAAKHGEAAMTNLLGQFQGSRA